VFPLLFSRVTVFDVLEHRQQTIKSEVKNLNASALDAMAEDQLIHELATRYKFEIPVIDDDKTYMSHREVDVDVSRDPMRLILDRNRPFYIKGTEITIKVPFRGDPNLFQVRPSSFTLNPPRGEISGHEICLTYTRTDSNAAAVRSDYLKSIQDIKQYLGWLETSLSTFNSNVGQELRPLIAQRRQQLATSSEMVASIGLPIKQTETKLDHREHNYSASALAKSTVSSKKWDVFISHASEDKDSLVRPLASALQQSGLNVWYDEFSLKVGDSLRTSIDYGLANSRYGIVVLSNSFFEKHWPVQELNGLTTKELNGKKVILPIWHNVGFDEVRAFSPILADRLAIPSNVGISRLVKDIGTVVTSD